MSTLPEDAPHGSPTWTAPVRRLAGEGPGVYDSRPATEPDEVIAEVPVALSFNGITHAVMMATPTAMEDFALGFALSEGLVGDAGQCLGIDIVPHGVRGIELRMEVTQRAAQALKARRRAMEGRTGCGLCGADSLDALDLAPLPLAIQAAGVPAASVLEAFAQLPGRQPLNTVTGGCHAAGWSTPEGRLLAVHEDVGRHNALDKLIGELARTGRLGTPGFVVMSSRCSYELVRKCARVGIGTLATISAPTSLAVQVASQARMRLLGFCRGDTVVEYTRPWA